MNLLAITTKNKSALNNVYNTAVGERTSLSKLVSILKKYLSKHDENISKIKVFNGPYRKGDIPHSLASIEKAKSKLGYNPLFNFELGIKETIKWYLE